MATPPADLRIRPVHPGDAAAISAIYAPFIRDTVITFEEEPVSVMGMMARIEEVSAKFPWLVAEDNGSMIGYAYASPFRGRSAYRFVVETTVYLAPEAMGKGIGRALYTALLDALREQGLHAAMGVIALPNDASVRLHEKLGFRKAGHFPEVGWKFDRWVDVGYWQLTL